MRAKIYKVFETKTEKNLKKKIEEKMKQLGVEKPKPKKNPWDIFI